MRNTGFVIIISLFYFSCKSDIQVPKDILPPEKMEKVMLDMVWADELLNRQAYSDSVAKTLLGRISLYQSVFTAHKIKKEQFQKSLNFYQNRPDLLKIVLDSMQSEAKRIEEKRNDSLTLKVNKKEV